MFQKILSVWLVILTSAGFVSLVSFLDSSHHPVYFLEKKIIKTAQASSGSDEEDKSLYEKYKNYLKYKRYKKYKKYKEKYGFKSKAERFEHRAKYKLYKSNKKAYAHLYPYYKRYKNYKNKYKKYAKYSKYKKYYNKRWKYKKYGKSKYKNAYNRYKASLKSDDSGSLSSSGSLGPEISVGILGFDKAYSKSHSIRIEANKSYSIKDRSGSLIATVSGGTKARVVYAGGGSLRVYGSGFDRTVSEYVDFTAADGNNAAMVFNVEPKSFDDYRGKMRVRYSSDSDKVWAINILPLEHYTWGMGEISGTGDMDYNRVMTIVFRTYGYWKMKYSTKYAEEGFKVDATAGNQIYYGYDWERGHSRIKSAAGDTRGKMVYYDGDVAITPYSSSTDGRTRSWKERWGSSNYPYCKSVDDPYGKVAGAASISGNHMVGLSATGALNLASDHGWSYSKILNYYYTGIEIKQVY
ncbi:MAG: hypothetical protein ABIC19_01655 [Patescibacteria group bacterium]|nr:hypothetical protein [Patescibacteria group bacterium]